MAQAALAVKQSYDLQRDFAPAAMLIPDPYVLMVRPVLAAKNVPELVALAKAAPGKLNYGSPGIGGQAHFAGEPLADLQGRIHIAMCLNQDAAIYMSLTLFSMQCVLLMRPTAIDRVTVRR